MTKKFQRLEEMMSAESRARARARAEELLAEKRSTSIRDLASGMEASFAGAQERVVADAGDVPPTSEAELEKLVGEARRKARLRNRETDSLSASNQREIIFNKCLSENSTTMH